MAYQHGGIAINNIAGGVTSGMAWQRSWATYRKMKIMKIISVAYESEITKENMAAAGGESGEAMAAK
jgi:hypothetical protein